MGILLQIRPNAHFRHPYAPFSQKSVRIGLLAKRGQILDRPSISANIFSQVFGLRAPGTKKAEVHLAKIDTDLLMKFR